MIQTKDALLIKFLFTSYHYTEYTDEYTDE